MLTLIQKGAFPLQIITTATDPPSDYDYQRRLRQWGADCVAHALPLIAGNPIAFQSAALAISVARQLAAATVSPAALDHFSSPQYSSLYDEARRTGFSVLSEIRLAAALCNHINVYLGTLGAITHARRALQSAPDQTPEQAERNELDWQVQRLGQWLADDEPTPLTA
jgi:hypothetical protein